MLAFISYAIKATSKWIIAGKILDSVGTACITADRGIQAMRKHRKGDKIK